MCLFLPSCNIRVNPISNSPFSPIPHPPHWQPSPCSLYPWICFCFVCSFVLFLRFLIQVKSMVFVFLWHLAQYPLGPSMLSLMARFHSFLLLSNVPLYMYLYAIFFIRSSVDGRPGCFRIWAVANITAVNTEVHIPFQISVLFSSDKYPELEFLGHKAAPFLILWETSILFPTVAAQICNPTHSAQGFPVLHILSTTCCLLIYWWWPFWQVWSDISWQFNLHFPDDYWC